MDGGDRHKLLFGPYAAPAPDRDGWLYCARLGRRVEVGGMHAGPIAWPYARRRGRHQLILCGDLVRAVRRESEAAVAHWWGVDPGTVLAWRRALGVPKSNEGSARLYRLGIGEKVTEQSRRRLAEGCRTEAYREGARRRLAARQVRPEALILNRWRPEEDALLGTDADEAIASRLGRTVQAVARRRVALGIPKHAAG